MPSPETKLIFTPEQIAINHECIAADAEVERLQLRLCELRNKCTHVLNK